MAIEEGAFTIYECRCDKCNKVFAEFYFVPGNLKRRLMENVWKQINGEWICPDCQEEEEV